MLPDEDGEEGAPPLLPASLVVAFSPPEEDTAESLAPYIREIVQSLPEAYRQAILLTGSHTWGNLQDYRYATLPSPRAMDFSAYLDFLQKHHHNFTRLWAWESACNPTAKQGTIRYDPMPYQRPGPGTSLDGQPRFDLGTDFSRWALCSRRCARIASLPVEPGPRAVLCRHSGVELCHGLLQPVFHRSFLAPL